RNINLILDGVESGTLSNVHVINLSQGRVAVQKPDQSANWWSLHPYALCGPNGNDDGTPGATQWCTPDNDDEWRNQTVATGITARTIAARAGAESGGGVLIGQSAGNR